MQLDYSENFPVAFVGMLADAGDHDIVSLRNLEPDTNSVTAVKPSVDAATTYNLIFTPDVGSAITVPVTTDATPTAAEIHALLLAAVNARSDLSYRAEMVGTQLRLVKIPTAPNQTITASVTGSPAGASLTVAALSAAGEDGLFVTRKSGDRGEAPSASGDLNLGGIVASSHFRESTASGAPKYPAGSAMNVLQRGRIWVRPEQAVTAGQQVFVRFVAAGAEKLGALRADADGADAAGIPARFLDDVAANALCRVEINMP